MTEQQWIETLSALCIGGGLVTLIVGKWHNRGFKTGAFGTYTWALSWLSGLALAAVELF